MPFLKQVVLISSTFRSVKTLSSFPLQFSRAVCFGKICQYVFYSPVLLWLLLPAGPVSPHTHHLGSLVPKPWTKGHHIWCFFLSFFFGKERKTNTQWPRTLVTKIKINLVIVFVAPLYHFTSIPVEESEQKGRLQRDHSRLWNRWNLSREKTPGLGGQASLDRLTRQWQWQSWQGQG